MLHDEVTMQKLTFTNGDVYEASARGRERPEDGTTHGSTSRQAASTHALTCSHAHAHVQGQVMNGSIRHGRGKHTCSTGDSYGALTCGVHSPVC